MAAVAGWVARKLLDTVGEWIADKFLGTTIDRLMTKEDGPASSSTGTDLNLVRGVEGLKSRLLGIKAVLQDAEEREIHQESESVKQWLKKIKLLAYDAEDVLDEYEYELLRYQMEGRAAPQSEICSSSSPRKRKRGEIMEEVGGQNVQSSFFNGTKGSIHILLLVYNPTQDDMVPRLMAKDLLGRINEISRRLDEIFKNNNALLLGKKDGLRQYNNSMSQQPTGSHVDELDIYGREDDRAKIVDMLLFGDEKFSVLPIVGMGGLGKTTLIQLVHNDERIIQFFNLKGWVYVSDNFDVVRLTRAIIESFTKKRCNLNELSALQDIIKEKLMGKRVLLVLDDIWNEKQSAWDLLKAPFVGAEIIKIIITTRSDSVARIMQTMPPYRLGFLSKEKSWLLFQRLAFNGRDPDKHPMLIDIGTQIVKKCGGLPLAVKVVGGILRHKQANVESWEDILHNNLWELNESQNEILPALKLSYRYVPTYLKPCFLYCSLFPKGRFLEGKQLIRLWMSQSYIIQPRGTKSLEDAGREYVEELQSRSLLQPDGSGLFRMHDLVHDLASSISGRECDQITVESDAETYNISSEVRHLHITNRLVDDVPRHLFSCLPKALRTIVFDGGYSTAVLDERFPLENLGCLRALDLCFRQVKGLPGSIGNLKHLRSFRLGYNLRVVETKIELPESMSQLYNLQVLDLGWHGEPMELPRGTGNLVNLRSLRGLRWNSCVPPGMGKLTNLETLEYLNVGRGGGMAALRGLFSLRHLAIRGLRNVDRVEDAREADLQSKQRIEKLVLEWDSGGDREQHGGEVDKGAVMELEAAVLNSLRPCTTLKALTIRNYHGARFPRWMGDPSFSRLFQVTLLGIRNCERLPALGQLPSLRRLYILRMYGLRYVGREFCCGRAFPAENAPFPSLEVLCFEYMPDWQGWCGAVDGDFPRLRRLEINDCPRLRSLTLPQTPTAALEWLSLRRCPELQISPYQRLLPSIPQRVIIEDCPRLTKWCQAHGITLPQDN